MKRTALDTFEPDLDLLQNYVEELSHLGQDISFINKDLDQKVQDLQAQAGVQSEFPLPDASPEVNEDETPTPSTPVQTSKFSIANSKGLYKVRRSASKLSFAQHEMEDNLITTNYTVVSPAYGRDYKSRAKAEADFLGGKDFQMESLMSGGRYTSIRDFAPGVKVNVRYNRLRNVTVVTVPSEIEIAFDKLEQSGAFPNTVGGPNFDTPPQPKQTGT